MSGKKLKISFSNERLKRVLKERGITLKELSDILHIPYNTLKYCSRNETIMQTYLFAICRKLNISPEYLTKENDRILEKESKTILKKNKNIDTIEQARELFYRFHDVAFVDEQGIIAFSYNEYSNEKDYKEPLKAYETFLISLSRNNQVHNFKTGETIIFNNSQEIKETIGESVYMDLYEYIVQEINKTIFKNTKKKGNNKR